MENRHPSVTKEGKALKSTFQTSERPRLSQMKKHSFFRTVLSSNKSRTRISEAEHARSLVHPSKATMALSQARDHS